MRGWNWQEFSEGAGEFFDVQGTFTDHDYFDGRLWDEYVVAIRRERWEALHPLLSELCGSDPEVG